MLIKLKTKPTSYKAEASVEIIQNSVVILYVEAKIQGMSMITIPVVLAIMWHISSSLHNEKYSSNYKLITLRLA
jgi:hypothetical protein